MSNQKKGARGERWFANKLKEIFPNIKRTGFLQADTGGVDLINSGCFDFECKIGKSYCYKGIRDMLDQIADEGSDENFDVVLVKPHYEEPYALIPFDDFLSILNLMKKEDIL